MGPVGTLTSDEVNFLIYRYFLEAGEFIYATNDFFRFPLMCIFKSVTQVLRILPLFLAANAPSLKQASMEKTSQSEP